MQSSKNQAKPTGQSISHRMMVPTAAAMSDFSGYLQSPLGKINLELEKAVLREAFSGLVGYNCLQLSVGKGLSLCDSSAVGHCIAMGYAPGLQDQDQLWADYQSFPIANDCIDIVFLHHVLEFSAEPTELLREADRTLTDGGYLLVLGFNPLSSWSIYSRYWRKKYRATQHTGQLIRQGRLHDWLAALNYEILDQRRYLSRLPINHDLWLKRTAWMEAVAQRCKHPFGMVYFTLARKKSTPLIPLSDSWRQSLRSQTSAVGSVSSSLKKNNTHKTC